MPLYGLEGRQGRLARLGIIRLGKQVPNSTGGGTHPVQTDHFVLTDAPDLLEAFGPECRELPVSFPYADFERNVPAFFKLWAGGLCVCCGDGRDVSYSLPFTVRQDNKGTHVNRAAGDWQVQDGVACRALAWGAAKFSEGDTVPCPGLAGGYPHCPVCRPQIIFRLMIRDPRCARFGFYQLSTGSIRNLTHMQEVWDVITDSGNLPIRMNSVPFVMKLVPGKAQYQEANGTWGVTTKYFLQFEIEPDLMRRLEAGRRQRMEMLLAGEPMEPAGYLETGPMLVDDEPEDPAGYGVQPSAPETKEMPPVEDAVFEDEPTGAYVVTFGKHKGKTLAQVQAEDPSYVRWIAEKSQNQGASEAAQAFLAGEPAAEQTALEPKHTNGTQQVPNGKPGLAVFVGGGHKHTGKTIAQVWNEDPEFLYQVARGGADPIVDHVKAFLAGQEKPAEPEPAGPAPELATSDQRFEIQRRMEVIGTMAGTPVTQVEIDGSLVKKGYPTLDKLTTEHAAEVIARLKEKHWVHVPAMRARFWGECGATQETVHIALGIEHVDEFLGTLDDALNVVHAYTAEMGTPEEPAGEQGADDLL